MNPTKNTLYFDYAATTPLDPEVAEAMLPYFNGTQSQGNPSSIHSFGRQARTELDDARDVVAQLIGADYSELYFTGSGTEADNLGVIGAMLAAPKERTQLITSSIEHHAVLHSAHYLQTQGYEVTILPVDSSGIVSLETLENALSEKTALVSLMHANNEIGSIQPIAEAAKLAHAHGAKFHTDAVQTPGVLNVSVQEIGCDLLTFCAHKIYGPKGAGALYIRQGTKVSPMIHGGSQEREKRAGTENVPAIVGFGKAAQLAKARREADETRITSLRDLLMTLLTDRISGIHLNGHPTQRLPGNVNVSVEGVDGTTLLMTLDRRGVAASSGSACSSGSIEPSHVLKAIGLPDNLAASGVRFSFGRLTTQDEVVRTAEIFAEIVERLRGVASR